MTLLAPSTVSAQGAARPRPCFRSDDELRLRDAVERWGRAKWPQARVCHELVVGRGTARADLAFVGPDHLVAVELKGPRDTTERLMNQAGMFRLVAPELWIVTAGRHRRDTDLIRYLMPSIGTATTDRDMDLTGPAAEDVSIVETAPASPFEPHPEALLSLLWVDELAREATRARLVQGRPRLSHATLVALMLRLDPAERLAAVCRQLRTRDAFWRADPPVPPPEAEERAPCSR